jgi:DNA-binding response OmpR family regulator
MERVLIVDDDPDIVRLVRYNLSHSGYEVQSAGTGREALELVQKQPPDLVVLDVMLPDVDGLEVCRTLRQQLLITTHSRFSCLPRVVKR